MEFFSLPPRPEWFLGPPSPVTNGYRGSFPEVKRLEREADYSPPSSAEVNKAWIYTSILPYAFMV